MYIILNRWFWISMIILINIFCCKLIYNWIDNYIWSYVVLFDIFIVIYTIIYTIIYIWPKLQIRKKIHIYSKLRQKLGMQNINKLERPVNDASEDQFGMQLIAIRIYYDYIYNKFDSNVNKIHILDAKRGMGKSSMLNMLEKLVYGDSFGYYHKDIHKINIKNNISIIKISSLPLKSYFNDDSEKDKINKVLSYINNRLGDEQHKLISAMMLSLSEAKVKLGPLELIFNNITNNSLNDPNITQLKEKIILSEQKTLLFFEDLDRLKDSELVTLAKILPVIYEIPNMITILPADKSKIENALNCLDKKDRELFFKKSKETYVEPIIRKIMQETIDFNLMLYENMANKVVGYSFNQPSREDRINNPFINRIIAGYCSDLIKIFQDFSVSLREFKFITNKISFDYLRDNYPNNDLRLVSYVKLILLNMLEFRYPRMKEEQIKKINDIRDKDFRYIIKAEIKGSEIGLLKEKIIDIFNKYPIIENDTNNHGLLTGIIFYRMFEIFLSKGIREIIFKDTNYRNKLQDFIWNFITVDHIYSIDKVWGYIKIVGQIEIEKFFYSKIFLPLIKQIIKEGDSKILGKEVKDFYSYHLSKINKLCSNISNSYLEVKYTYDDEEIKRVSRKSDNHEIDKLPKYFETICKILYTLVVGNLIQVDNNDINSILQNIVNFARSYGPVNTASVLNWIGVDLSVEEREWLKERIEGIIGENNS